MFSRKTPLVVEKTTRPATSGGLKASWLYRAWLTGPTPGDIRRQLPNQWPGDPQAGHRVLDGDFAFRGESYPITLAAALPDDATEAWQAWFHGFGWLADLAALDGVDAANQAQRLSGEWIEANRHWQAISWAPEVAAERLIAWLTNWSFLTTVPENADASRRALKKNLLKQAARDSRHLARALPTEHDSRRLHTIKGLVATSLSLFARGQKKAIARLIAEIEIQILADGGHVERSPEALAMVLRDLLDLRSWLAATGEDVPGALQNAIDRIAPTLRLLRHPDGGLALFNGGAKGDVQLLDQLLVQAESTATQNNAPLMGFQRLSSGATHIIMDCGVPGGPGPNHHAGTLSFEMSIGNQRMVVNCGTSREKSQQWHQALATTAAHSTLTVNDTSSAAFDDNGKRRRGPTIVPCERRESDEQDVAVEASHDGYAAIFGLKHHRAIFVAGGGEDVRGEDRLAGTGGEAFTIRFHLHPGVHASLLSGGEGVLIKLGKNDLWRFRVSGAEVSLGESIYSHQAGRSRACEQIICTGPLSGNGVLVKWAFQRESIDNKTGKRVGGE